MIVKGFATSYQGMPVGGNVPTDQLGSVLIHAFSMMFLAALQIAGRWSRCCCSPTWPWPLLSRAAPALNIFSFGFPVKILLTLTMLGLTFPLLPPALDALIEAGGAGDGLPPERLMAADGPGGEKTEKRLPSA
jgi:flagellar biosynthetic protein FliR